MTIIARPLLLVEAIHSTSLDGMTHALDGMTQSMPYRQHGGFGCPHCGQPIDMAGPICHFLRGLPCCGYLPSTSQLRRFTTARLALRQRSLP